MEPSPHPRGRLVDRAPPGRHHTDARRLAPLSAGSSGPTAGRAVPDDDWTNEPVDAFGTAYDSVDRHGWYRNLDPTVEELAHLLADGDILVDYSGGTGILLDRLKLRMFDTQVGAVIVDSSPKFLRVALEKFRDDPKVGFRLLRFLKDEKRLQRLDEVLGPELVERGVDVIASTNAIHLYPELPDTVASWVRALRPGGHVLINSGNIRNPRARQQRVDPRRDRLGRGRPGRGAGAHRSGLRRIPRRPRGRRAHEDARRVPRPGVPAAAAARLSTSRRSSWPA